MEDLVDSSTDWSSSDSDDSDLDELLNDDDTEMILLLFGIVALKMPRLITSSPKI
jgi:hypothetical protein